MIVTLTGSNGFALKTELNRNVSVFLSDHGDMGLERLDGEEVGYERITEAIQSMPFLAEKKLVIIRNPGSVKQFADNFETLIASIPETNDVIIVEPKIDKRTGYYKQLKKNTDFKEFSELAGSALSQWLVDKAKKASGTLSAADAQYLVDRVGGNQQMLGNELEKLLLHDKHITKQTIDRMTEPEPQSTVFELLEAAFAGNTNRALELYADQRKQKVEPLAILAMVSWQLHVLALVKTAGDRSIDEIAQQSKLNPYVVRKSQYISSKLSVRSLRQLIKDVLNLDVRLKREAIDPDEALNHLLIKVSNL